MRQKAIVTFATVAGLAWLISIPLQGQELRVRVPRPDTGDKKETGDKKDKLDDATFVKKAAHGGKAEVELGKLAEKNAQSDDVKKFGKRMVKDHSMANKELMEICEKCKFDVPKGIGKEHKDLYEKLSKMEGKDFDVAYMKAMVKDHEEDAEEFAEAAKSLKNDDLKAFAAKTLPIIQEHLKMAKSICSKVEGSGK